MSKIDLASPVVKWVGGKRQLLERLMPLFPETYTSYCEPFIGGGAVLFALQPKNAIINDINSELIGVYRAIKDDVEALIKRLVQFENTKECFYEVRGWDRNAEFYNQLTDIDEYFNTADVTILNTSYSEAVQGLPENSFVYLDPPYDPISVTASFTGYNAGGFSREDQIALRDCCRNLDAAGIKFMLSNSATEFIQDIYSDFNITIVPAKRAINSVGSKRGCVDEVIVRNYE